MGSHIQLFENGRAIGLDGRPWSPAPRNAWTGFPFEVHKHICRSEVTHRYNPNALVFLHDRACGQSRIRSAQHTYDLTIAPGQIDIYPAGFQMDYGWWDCTPGRLCAIELCAQQLRELLEEDSDQFGLRITLSGCDPSLAQLLRCIRTEIKQHCPSGKLFADGLSLALVGYLKARYPATDTVPQTRGRLSKAQVKLIVEFVEGHLGSDLRVTELAALLDLSPHYFHLLFRTSFGMTPHRYVLQRRMEAARRMLRTETPITDIAYSLGFSSQAHFTQAFRRHTGSTPARVRRT
jgi:AraC family transcriptional regulator